MTLLDEASRVLKRIHPRRTGFYVPTRDGMVAILVPVLSASAELIDIVAYAPGNPERWWLRTGLGSALGEDALERCRNYDDPILVCGTPREWTRERAYGLLNSCCVLDRRRASAVLAGLRVISREDLRHAA